MSRGFYPILELSLELDGLSIKITPTRDQNVSSHCQEAIDGFQVIRGAELAPSASLVFCAEPEPGLARIQAREQAGYDLWLKWKGEDTPRVFLGDDRVAAEYKLYDDHGHAVLNWGNYVGASCVRVVYGERKVIRLAVEVRSRKMDYLDDYRTMLDDISERLAALIFDYGSPTAVYAQRAAADDHVAYLDYLFIRYLMEKVRLPLHFRLLAADPHRVTQREVVWSDLSLARTLTPRAVQAMIMHAEHLARPQRAVAPALELQLDGHVPRQVLDERVITTFDTPPNRFVKHFLEQLILKLRELEGCFGHGAKSAHLAQDCRGWRRGIENLSRAHFLEEVSQMHIFPSSSQVLLKREGYRQLNDYFRRFLLAGKVTWEDFEELLKTPNKDLATLYEYWCFFQLLDAVAVAFGAEVNPRQFIQEDRDIFRVTINQGGKSKGQVGSATVYYNRSFRRPGESYSVTLRPDYTIELLDGRRLVFDAKYKYDRPGQFMSRDIAQDEEQDEEQRLTYKRGDLYKMHTYRDALGAQAVFVLYPGNEFQAFCTDGFDLRRPEELTRDFQGVGAIPLGPYSQSSLRKSIRGLIENIQEPN